MTNKKIVFIVEDDPDILELMQIVVENENFQVKTFLDAEKAEIEIIEKKPALVLMDLHVGKIDGAKIVKKLKTKRETSKIPMILVSAKNSLDDISHNSKADGFLKKPFDIKELTQIVRKLM